MRGDIIRSVVAAMRCGVRMCNSFKDDGMWLAILRLCAVVLGVV